MTIDTIVIRSFGKLQDVSVDLGKGINIIRGNNESGKSTLCNFIKFIFYGLAGRGDEKLRYISWNTLRASGYIDVSENGHQFRIDRDNYCVYGSDGKAKLSERCVVTELSSGRPVFQGKVPGEVFFGVNESVFNSTAFIDQLTDSKVGGKDLAEAAQNILFSGSEDVNVQKAVKKLDDARKILLYKNQNGGRIYDLQKECDSLSERLEKAEGGSSALIVAEGNYRETKQKLETSKERFDKVSKEMDLWNKYTVYKLMKKRQETYSSYSEAKKKEEEALSDKKHFGARVYEDRYSDGLKKCEFELNSAQESYREAKKSRDEAQAKMKSMAEKVQLFNNLGSDPHRRAELIENIRNNHKKVQTLGMVSLITLILSVLLLVAAGAAFFIPTIPQNLAIVFVSAFAVLFVVSLIVISAKSGANKKLKNMYSKFNCKSYEEFSETMSAAMRDETVITLITETLRSSEDNLNDKTDKLNALKRQISDKLSSDGFQVSEDILSSLRSAIEECRKSKELLGVLNNNTNVEKRSIENIDETLSQYKQDYLQAVMTMEFNEEELAKFDYEKKEKEFRFLKASLDNLAERMQQLKNDISVFRATNEDPANLAVELDSKTRLLETYKQKYVAYVMAIEAVNNASGRLRESVSPKIADSAGKYLSELSDGKYSSVQLDTDFSVRYEDGHYFRSADNLSAGTEDITYISLRLALIDTLYKAATPPLLFDESFSRTDNSRLTHALKLLSSLAESNVQTILFTCHDREERVMESVGKYTLAKLS